MRKLFSYLAMTVLGAAVACGLTACSSDEPAPALENIVGHNVTPLTQDGVMVATFSTQPAGIAITKVSTDSKGFEVTDVKHIENDMWQVTLNVSDFACVKSGEQIRLTIAQSDSVAVTAQVNVEDPFSIVGKYDVACPETFTIYDLETKQTIGLPVLITAENAADLDDITSMELVNVGLLGKDDLTADLFEVKPMTDEVGCYLVGTKKIVDKIMSQQNPTMLRPYGIRITGKNGRTAVVDLYTFACPSETTYTNDALTVDAPELSNIGFKKEGTLDAKTPLLRIGFRYPIEASDPDLAKFTQKLMYVLDSEGNKVNNPMIANTVDISTYNLDYTLTGAVNSNIAPGTYYNVYRYELSWDFRGKSYPRIAANINYELNVK